MRYVVTGFSATVHIGLSTSIEGYHLPDGSFRYALNYVSCLLGYSESYFLRLIKNSPKKLKTLQSKGFTSDIFPVKVTRESKRGASLAQTINFNDFCTIVEYEAIEVQNPKAIALLTSSFREVLRSRTQDAFGLPQDSFEKRIVFFDLSYEQREKLLSEDREDILDLELLGDFELCSPSLEL